MNLKIYISALLIGASALGVNAGKLLIQDTITDNHIVYPSSLDTDLKDLQENWYFQRYAVLDSTSRKKSNAEPSDEVYIKRLQSLPNIIEMPYNSIVKNYIEMYAIRKPQLVEKMLGMSLYYMPIFEAALEKYQLPNELKYLPIIESALNPNAISKSGAGGLWQFMPVTAAEHGLEVNSLVDQRRDPFASSDAAACYLSKLYKIFGDWTLAIAAYNCGPGTVNKAIKRAGNSKDYWAIYPYLPEETRGYVPAFIAANYIMNYYPEHDISHALARRPIVTDTVHVNKRVHFQQISDVLGLPIDEIRIFNPQYRNDIIPGHIHPYTLTLPSVQAYCYVANEDSIINHNADQFFGRETVEPYSLSTIKSDKNGQYVEQPEEIIHVVAKGESLKSIARKYGVTAESIRKANNLSSSRVKQGTKLKILIMKKVRVETPANNDTIPQNTAANDSIAASTPEIQNAQPAKEIVKEEAAKPQPASQYNQQKKENKPTTYIVKSGDSYSRIAKKFGVTVKALQDANPKYKNLQPGDKLVIPAKGKSNTNVSNNKKTNKGKGKSSKSKKSSKKKK